MNPSPFTLRGRRVLVVGATGALGRACSWAAAQLGAEVFLTGRDATVLEGVRSDCREAGAQAESLAVDLTDQSQLRVLIEALPLLDGLVFAAGIASVKPFSMLTTEEVGAVWRINTEAAIWLTQALVRGRRVQEGGSLIYLASIAGRRGAAAHSVYCASKGALIAWARSLAVELATKKIRVNTISPGLVASPMADDLARKISSAAFQQYAARYPLGVGRPEDVAWAVCFLLSPAAGWITGTDLVVDGGISAG